MVMRSVSEVFRRTTSDRPDELFADTWSLIEERIIACTGDKGTRSVRDPSASAKALERVLDHEAVTITTKNGNAVIISEEDWEGIKETLYLMGDPEFLNDVREARRTPVSEREVWNCHT